MILKEYQQRAVGHIETFFNDLDAARKTFEATPALQTMGSYVNFALSQPSYGQFSDRPQTGVGNLYPRVCIKMPTAGGKTLVAIETIRAYQNLLAKKKTGLVVWITHRDQIYRQTIENLQNKSHPYRQFLDQMSGNRTLILEKGRAMRRQDMEENLVILMLMIQSATRDTNKIFEDSGGYTDFFPSENRYDLHKKLSEEITNLDTTADSLFEHSQVKTSLGNVIRLLNPLIIVDEFHTMFTDIAQATLNNLNPSAIVGLSATPKRGMNIVSSISGRDLKAEGMVKLDMHLRGPNQDWQEMLAAIKKHRDGLEKVARKHEQNKGVYIRPIALIQVERTGKEQRGQGRVHSEDVRDALVELGAARHEIAVKSSSLDEIKQEKLLSKESEIRYIITKEALKEGWDCSFAYILGVIPNARNNASMTQLVGRILRQPYAKKTGISELDESYVFFASGHTQEVLEKVKKGFDDEGLGDVVSGIQVRDSDDNVVSGQQMVLIKPSIRKKYRDSLFLPVWLMKDGSSLRKFSYAADIKRHIEWDKIKLDAWLKKLKPTIGKQRKTQVETIVDLEGQTEVREVGSDVSISFDTLYLTRRLSSTIDNAFIAQGIANKLLKALSRSFKESELDRDAGYIAREVERRLLDHKREQERSIFEKLVTSKRLILAVTDDADLGFALPEQDMVANTVRSAYQYSLYEDVDISSLNSLERAVVHIIEQSPNVLWWARNKVDKGWYAVQGWQKNKVRPDFIVAKKNTKEELEFVYVIESKGEQLAGNSDTQYKDDLFVQMNDLRGKIKQMRFRTTTLKLNNRFEFELVPQGEEERRIRTKLNV